MAEREQIKRSAPSRTEEEVEETTPAGAEKGEKLKAELAKLEEQMAAYLKELGYD